MIKITLQSRSGVQAHEGAENFSFVADYLHGVFKALTVEDTTAALITDKISGFDLRIEIAPDQAEGGEA